MSKNKNKDQELEAILSEINSGIKNKKKVKIEQSQELDQQSDLILDEIKQEPKPPQEKPTKKISKKSANRQKRNADNQDKPKTDSSKDSNQKKETGEQPATQNSNVRYISVEAPTTKKDAKKTSKQKSNIIDLTDNIDNIITFNKADDDDSSDAVVINPTMGEVRRKIPTIKQSRRKKRTAILGGFMTLFFIIGVVTTCISAFNFSKNLINNTKQKEEFARVVFPFVIIDVPEFSTTSNLDNSAIISASIWAFIIDDNDKSKYSSDDFGTIFVPEKDIEPYIRKLFGNSIPIKHQAIVETSVAMDYNETSKEYSIELTPRFLPYTPKVDKIIKKGDLYTLTVHYILPDVVWNLDHKNKSQNADKTMEYTLKKNGNDYEIVSVKFISLNIDTTPNIQPEQPYQDPDESDIDTPETQSQQENDEDTTTSEPNDDVSSTPSSDKKSSINDLA